MDYTIVGFDSEWEDEASMKKHRELAIFYACLFAWFGSNLLISIIRTIATNPGNIPEDKEWDMETTENTDNEELAMSDS